MRRPRPTANRVIVTVLAVAATGVAGCARRPPAVDPAYRAEIEAWRAERLARLTAADGWLTLTGLFWLRPGANRFGSDPGNEVVLPAGRAPGVAGTLELRSDATVVVHPAAGAALTIDGAPAAERALASDRQGRPDLLRLGSLTFYVIDRAGKLGVRVKDAESPARVRFKGIEHFPVDPAFRVRATFEPYPSPREVRVATVQGPTQTMTAPGLVRFTLGGRPLALEPFLESPTDTTFFFVFKDATSARETYGAGRFLDAAAPPRGTRELVLDFNEAYTPPCGFTPFATCPLPPPENVLPVGITAGEKYHGAH